MLKFDIEKVELKEIYIKEITSQGHIHYFNTINFCKEIVVKADKSFYSTLKAAKKPTCFFKPKKAFLVCYDGYPISLEFVMAEVYYYSGKSNNSTLIKRSDEELEELISRWETEQRKYKENLIALIEKYPDSKFYFDGKYVNVINDSILEKSKDISKDGSFKIVNVPAIGLRKLNITDRFMMYYNAVNPINNEKVNAYLPTFSKVTSLMKSLEEVNEKYFVNLKFVIDSSKHIGNHFGVGALQFLQIEDIMLDLKVLNIHSISDSVLRFNYFSKDIIPVLAWIAKFSYRSENINQLLNIKTLLSKLFTVNDGHLSSISRIVEFENNTFVPTLVKVKEYRNEEEVQKMINEFVKKHFIDNKEEKVLEEEEAIF